jgi:hypothetical protein
MTESALRPKRDELLTVDPVLGGIETVHTAGRSSFVSREQAGEHP